MSASVFATITTLQMIGFCKNHEAFLKVEVFMFFPTVIFPAHTEALSDLHVKIFTRPQFI